MRFGSGGGLSQEGWYEGSCPILTDSPNSQHRNVCISVGQLMLMYQLSSSTQLMSTGFVGKMRRRGGGDPSFQSQLFLFYDAGERRRGSVAWW